MAYLHENKREFHTAVNLASEKFHIVPSIVEKDYYVTMVLRLLAEKVDYAVFKGGTSLSKCHRAIKRFSEDIDITIDTKISQGQMRSLKQTIKEIAQELGLGIPNLDETRSRRSYNRYLLEYSSVESNGNDVVLPSVLLETSFAEISFPVVRMPVYSYIGEMMEKEAPAEIENYKLKPFEMKVQGLDRTLVDKVFALCDYYMQDKIKGHSRHIYDIYKIIPLVSRDEAFRKLVRDVRTERAKNTICPSAQPDIDVSALIRTIIEKRIYKDDYDSITARILEEDVPYDTAVEALSIIASSGLFEKSG